MTKQQNNTDPSRAKVRHYQRTTCSLRAEDPEESSQGIQVKREDESQPTQKQSKENENESSIEIAQREQLVIEILHWW